MDVPEERLVSVRPRTIVTTTAVLLAVGAAVLVLWVARHAITWILISLFLAMALNPAVEALQRRGLRRRGAAAAAIYLLALAVVAVASALLLPRLVDQVGELADAAPGYVHDFTSGRGPLGFLEREYHVTDRVRDALTGDGGSGGAAAEQALSITRGIVTGIAGLVTIVFMTFFMLLEGPAWIERAFSLLPEASRPRWRGVAGDIYKTVGGYVSGNLLISVIAGVTTTVVLLALGVPYPLALGMLVAVLDLIPLAGATLAAIVVSLIAFLTSTTAGVVVLVFFVVYQQLENHLLQPLVYGRTVQLSPLAVLISVLIGAEVAGVVGALGAIPVAGSLQVLLRDWAAHRAARRAAGIAVEPRFSAQERATTPAAPAP